MEEKSKTYTKMITDYKTKLTQAYEQNEQYHSKILDNENTIKDHKNTVTELTMNVNNLEIEVENKDNKITELNSAIEKYIFIYNI